MDSLHGKQQIMFQSLWNLHQAHLQEVGQMQFQLTMLVVRPLDENQRTSQLHSQSLWLVYEVALTSKACNLGEEK